MSKSTDAVTLLEKNFDVAFAAPDGIKKLRELILSLAMQGKLVPQNPSDQPASELLKEIAAGKSRLVKDGKIKASKPLPEIKPDEVPYDLPKSWEWVRLGSLFRVTSGTNLTKDKMQEGIYPVYGGNGIAGYHSEFNTEKATIVIGRVGYYCGSIHLTPKHAWITDNAFFTIYDEKRLYQPFVIWLLKKTNLQTDTSATAQPVISGSKIYPLLTPLPPLAEQRRIVTKIDELMARCDELEKLKAELNQKQITVHKSALNRLLTAKDNSDFKTSWHFITQHFGELYSVKENVAELRKAILQLAVMGKLVPQDQNDQPASELLKEIVKEKRKLIKEGKIKASKPLREIELEELPYDLPKGWEWVRFGVLIQSMNNGLYKSSKFYSDQLDQGVKIARMFNIQDGFLDLGKVKRLEVTPAELQNYKLSRYDILVNRVNSLELVGKAALVRNEDLQENLVYEAMNIRVSCFFRETDLPSYANLLLKTINARSYLIGQAKRALGQVSISQPQVSNLLFSLPPLAEQHRILNKIDQLMTLCDELEKQIDAAESKQTNLLNSVMTKV